MPHDHGHVLARLAQGHARARRAGDRGGRARRSASGRTGRGRTAPRCSSRPPSCSPTTWRDDAQRRDDARPVEDGVPGRDRRGVRADRLLALQRRLRAGALRRAADQRPRRCGTSSTTAPLEGFVYAVTPFNFTAIGGNLPTAPALMGNTVVWKPAATRDALARYYIMKLLEEAGLPPGVINFVPGDPREISQRRCSRTAISPACTSPAAPASSTACGRPIGANMSQLPLAIRASSARPAARTSSSRTRRPIREALAVAIVRGGFEYQGQKCSAASRVYVPRSLWPEVRDRMVGDDRRRSRWATSATSATSWAR